MILAFKQQFVPAILDGTKIHTIREDKTGRWKPGNKIHFATGVRTPYYNNFIDGECARVQEVFMTYAYNDLIEISVDDRELFGYQERMEFARNDGFETWAEFFDWFYPIIIASPDQCFRGKVIHWTLFKY